MRIRRGRRRRPGRERSRFRQPFNPRNELRTTMKKKFILASVPLVILLAGLALKAAGAFESDRESTDDAYVSADYTLVAPKVSGLVDAVFVDDNQRVKAGDPLAHIDDRDFRVALQTAEAELLSARARLENVRAREGRQQAAIAQAKATLAADDAALTFANQNAQRYRNLSRQGAGTEEQQQQADFTQKQQSAVRRRDGAALDAAQRELNVLSSERAEAESAVQQAEAAVQQATLNLSYTNIVAPVDGVVGQRSVRVGAYVNAGTTLLAVVPLDEAYVVAHFRETQLARMRAGQPATIEVDALPGVRLRGHVDSVAPATGLTFAPIAPDNATGNFTKVVQRLPVKIRLEHGQADVARLRVGMSVVPSIDVGHGEGARR
ncbi:HlyD family secretion protein [Burkholderia cenocepacia]|uniref:HlyD family secretion protein n=1 Tax=Burkholderia cenocepacia TaxID=95486 RepID=UPI002AB69161|nr:HlyD family secretion protein [Burkholderia cenocepacia]